MHAQSVSTRLSFPPTKESLSLRLSQMVLTNSDNILIQYGSPTWEMKQQTPQCMHAVWQSATCVKTHRSLANCALLYKQLSRDVHIMLWNNNIQSNDLQLLHNVWLNIQCGALSMGATSLVWCSSQVVYKHTNT